MVKYAKFTNNHVVGLGPNHTKMARHPTRNHQLISSTSLTEIRDETEIYMQENNSTHLSVTTVLNYCKRKILNPYLRLLSVMGLRPLICDQQEPSLCFDLLSLAYIFLVIVFILIGYFLQYMACFRRDRGFCQKSTNENVYLRNESNAVYEQTCNGSLTYSFIIPSCLHLIGYLHAVVIFRSSDDDQLPVLMERVFLSLTNLSTGFLSQKKLVKTLWLFVLISILWMMMSLGSVIFMMASKNVTFKWIENRSDWINIVLKTSLVVCTLCHDAIQATVISNYCLQAQLLTSYLQFLREKLLQNPTQPIEWMRDAEDFKKMLNYFNDEIAPSVCLFTIVNICCSISGLLWLFNYDHIDRETMPIVGLSIVNVSLWIVISIAPFVQACRLTSACDVLRSSGQEVRTRPFVHQDTPSYELDSILMYTASLKLKAKLFHMPITGKYLCFFVTASTILILVLGQCHYLLGND